MYMQYGVDLEAFSWCLTPGDDSVPLEVPVDLEFFPIFRNAGALPFSGSGTVRMRLIVYGNWYAYGSPRDAQKIVNVPITIQNLEPGGLLKLTEGLKFDWVVPPQAGGPRAGKKNDETAIIFDYRFYFDDDECHENDYYRALLGQWSHQLAAFKDLHCSNCEVESEIKHYDGPMVVPGMCIGLWHNLFADSNPSVNRFALPPLQTSYHFVPLFTQDQGICCEWNWWMARDIWEHKLDPKFAPPGLALALRHTHQANANGVTYLDFNPICDAPPQDWGVIRRQGKDEDHGGDCGFYWYETADQGWFSDDKDWNNAEQSLPEGTVIGLARYPNLDVGVKWRSETYHSARLDPAPPGFVLRGAWDMGAPGGHGFTWYEKTTPGEVGPACVPSSGSMPSIRKAPRYNEIYGDLSDMNDPDEWKMGELSLFDRCGSGSIA